MPRKASNKRTGSSSRRTKRVQRGGGKNTPVEPTKPYKGGFFGRFFGGKEKTRPSISAPINPNAKMNTAFEEVRKIAGTEAGNQARYSAAANIGNLVSPDKRNMFNVTSGNAIRASPNPNNAARAIMRAVNPKANQQQIYLTSATNGNSNA